MHDTQENVLQFLYYVDITRVFDNKKSWKIKFFISQYFVLDVTGFKFDEAEKNQANEAKKMQKWVSLSSEL